MNADRRYASRKFLLACCAFVAGVVFFAFDQITAEQWLTHTQWTLGLYFAANVSDQSVTRT